MNLIFLTFIARRKCFVNGKLHLFIVQYSSCRLSIVSYSFSIIIIVNLIHTQFIELCETENSTIPDSIFDYDDEPWAITEDRFLPSKIEGKKNILNSLH